MSTTTVIARKEILDNLRDRRTLFAAILYPVLGPAMILLLAVGLGRITQQSEDPLELPVVGAENAPNLMSFLEQQDVIIKNPPEDPEASVLSGELDVVLIVPESFGETLQGGRPAPLQLIMDESRTAAVQSIRRASILLDSYGRTIGRLRLLARGVDPIIIDPIAIERVDLSTPQSQAARFFNIAPYFIVFSAFVGGMYLAIDSTAGERERGSLEPLLTNPATRTSLVMGKAVAVWLFTAVAVVESIVGFTLVLNLFPLERYLGIRMSLPLPSAFTLLGIMIPLSVFAVALQMMIASYTKSFKEAQNYISLLLIIPALPAIMMTILPVKNQVWMMLIPTFGQQLLMNRVLRAEALDPGHLALSCLGTGAIAAGLFWLVVQQYRREGILFR